MNYELIRVSSPEDWRAYHSIRREVLFETPERQQVYDENHPDEFLPDHHPLLLKYKEQPIGTTRLDDLKNGGGIIRLVAISIPFQGRGHGRVLSHLVEKYALKLGITILYVNAAPEAVGYYEKMGWAYFSWNPSELTGIARECVQMKKIIG